MEAQQERDPSLSTDRQEINMITITVWTINYKMSQNSENVVSYKCLQMSHFV